jgi:prepilin-type processing-associated H-X9-DG protein
MTNLVKALLIALVVVIAGGLAVVAVGKVRESAARSQCVNNLRIIGMSVQTYREQVGVFPQAGLPNPALPPERRLSWLVATGAFIEASQDYNKMDLQGGWDAEENRYAALTQFRYLRCPNYPEGPPVSTLVPTHYVGLGGLGADAAALPPGDPRAGFFGYDRQLKLPDLHGRASTLLIAADTSQAEGSWTAAGPATIRGLEPGGPPYRAGGAPLGGLHPGKINVLFADESVRFLRDDIRPEVLEALVVLRGGEKLKPVAEE